MTYALVMTTTSSEAEAATIAEAILQARLAACIQVLPITSYYTWEGKQQREGEYLLLIKGKAENFSRLQECIQSHHSYKVPEIIQIPITQGSPTYLEWMAAVTD
ncbi:MAG: divalent-cation tolerance protein CutA [Pseudanabaenaceae cyanobacterium]